MIRFCPDYQQGMSKDQIDNVLKFCEELYSSSNIFCPSHPEVETIIFICIARNGIGFKIFDACCSNFKSVLERKFEGSLYQ